jgi:adenylate cyclase
VNVFINIESILKQEGRFVKLSVGRKVIPVGNRGEMLLNWYGPGGTFTSYSVSDILYGSIPQDAMDGKIVLVGSTTVGIYDMIPTPVDPTMPGVEFHATALENILHDQYILRPDYMKAIEFLSILFIGLVVGLAFCRLKLTAVIFTLIFLTAAIYYSDRYFLFSSGHWMKIFYPISFLWFEFIVVTSYRHFSEEREKRKIKRAFQFYLTKSVMEEILKDTSKLKLGGDRRELTVLFSDIRNFTAISEQLAPEKLVSILNSYLTPMTNIIFKFEGILDKYVGDEVMAVFGAPLDQKDHAERACYTALEMVKVLRQIREDWVREGLPHLDIGVGINTGPMAIGNMGSELRFDYTVIGDMVNLGSRLQGLTKQYGVNVIISEFTKKAIGDKFFMREMDFVRVKGKRWPVRIYELISEDEPEGKVRDAVMNFHYGIESYRNRKWDEAIGFFQVCLALKPDDPPSKLFIQRCGYMKNNPPDEDWDGVYTALEK